LLNLVIDFSNLFPQLAAAIDVAILSSIERYALNHGEVV
jgi:hypothetical protein